MSKENIKMTKDGLTAIYDHVDENGVEKSVKITWKDKSKVPPHMKLLKIMREMATETSRESSVQTVDLPFGAKVQLGYMKDPDFDKAAIKIGKFKLEAPMDKNGKIDFKAITSSKTETSSFGFGARKAFFANFKAPSNKENDNKE